MFEQPYTPMPHETWQRVDYRVLMGADRKPHMYLQTNDDQVDFVYERGAWHESHYDGIHAVYFHEDVFQYWLNKPHAPGDTFQLFGWDWLVIPVPWYRDMWFSHMYIYCVPDRPSSNRLLMFLLKHQTDFKLWYVAHRDNQPQLQHIIDFAVTIGEVYTG